VARRLPGPEVVDRQQRLVLLHILVDRLGDLAGIEDVGAAPGNGAQGLAVVTIHDRVAYFLGLAVGPAIERTSSRREAGALEVGRAAEGAVVGPPEMDVRAHCPTVLGPMDGGLDD